MAQQSAPLRAKPTALAVPEGARTLKVDCRGTIDIKGQRYRIGKTLAREQVLLEPVEQRWLVFYCFTLAQKINPATQCSTIVEHWVKRPTSPTNV